MLDYRGEIESDLSVLHGVRSLEDIDGPRFFRLVDHLAWYDGALRGRLRLELAERQPAPQAAASPAPAAGAPVMDIADVAGMTGPNREGFPWIEYRGGAN